MLLSFAGEHRNEILATDDSEMMEIQRNYGKQIAVFFFIVKCPNKNKNVINYRNLYHYQHVFRLFFDNTCFVLKGKIDLK